MTSVEQRRVVAPRLSALLGVTIAIGALIQSILAGEMLAGHEATRGWHEAIGTLIVVPAAINILLALPVRRGWRDSFGVAATRWFLAGAVVLAIVSGHGYLGGSALHVPMAVLIAGIGVRQATGFIPIPWFVWRTGRSAVPTAGPIRA
jgi:hypothetical protein